ncbi:hypothetical protein HDU76_012044 [Blyttiomyces sp. JEL0837]|nr:hypothetical protein HDU76_012044 [Blyttiomyces sp. JEL0837]
MPGLAGLGVGMAHLNVSAAPVKAFASSANGGSMPRYTSTAMGPAGMSQEAASSNSQFKAVYPETDRYKETLTRLQQKMGYRNERNEEPPQEVPEPARPKFSSMSSLPTSASASMTSFASPSRIPASGMAASSESSIPSRSYSSSVSSLKVESVSESGSRTSQMELGDPVKITNSAQSIPRLQTVEQLKQRLAAMKLQQMKSDA